MNSRRNLLKAGVLIGGSALIGGSFYYRGHVKDRELASLLTSFLDYVDLARSTGKRIQDSDTSLNESSFTQSISDFLTLVGTSRKKLSSLTREDLLQSLHERSMLDFSEENIVIVDGWILSKTEASLCVLAFYLSQVEGD